MLFFPIRFAYSFTPESEPENQYQNHYFKFRTTAEILFENEQLRITTAFPNPASINATLEYQMFSPVNAKITVSNVLGNTLNTFNLDFNDNKIIIPTTQYESGVYFYTLSIDNKSIITKKLVVKH